jgi:hypothetical protein
MEIVLRAMAEIFEVLDVEIVHGERHAEIFAANSHFVSPSTFPPSFPRKREPGAPEFNQPPPVHARSKLWTAAFAG